MTATHLTRRPVLGVDPRLIVVFELDDVVAPADFTAAEMAVLDYSSRAALVAFPSSPDMAAFLERVEEYRHGVPEEEGRTGAAYERLVDAISRIRPYGPQDRITSRLGAQLEALSVDEEILVDIECWFPASYDEANTWLDELEAAVERGGGVVLDRYLNPAAALSLARVAASARTVEELSQLDVIAQLDSTPVAPISTAKSLALTLDDLPPFQSAARDAPLVGVIDSGVQSAHPLLAGSIADAVAISPGLPDGQDRHGHGTAIASRVLFGDLRDLLSAGAASPPHCRILSVRVLDSRNAFPQPRLWVREVEEAIRYCAAQGARIINLSIGDPDTPYRGAKSTPLAAVIDELVLELGIVVLIPTGNVAPVAYCAVGDDDSLPRSYVDPLAGLHSTAMLDPGPAALALTVGGLVARGTSAQLERVPLGEPNWPSPVSRTGPGIEQAIKPEVMGLAGTYAYDRVNREMVSDHELACLVADGSGAGLIASDMGTSLATADVSRVAAAVVERYPEISAELVRALLLQSTDRLDEQLAESMSGTSASERLELAQRLVGYGRPRLTRAASSTPHRVVLVAEGQILPDEVHLYRIPIPSSFFQRGGDRGLTVSLSYSAPTRVRRMDYLSSRLQFELVRGLSADEVIDLFMTMPDEEEGMEPDTEDEPADSVSTTALTFSSLGSAQIPLRGQTPSRSQRSRGANQLASRRFGHRLREEDGTDFILGVKNVNRWAEVSVPQRYGLAVGLWRDERKEEIYTELEAELQALVEVPIELRL